MPNKQNIQVLENLTDKFQRARGIYFTNYKGMNVQQITELRRELHNANIEYRVVKKTLTSLAAQAAGIADVEGLMNGQTAVAISYTDPTQPGKTLTAFIKKTKNEQLTITGCVFDKVVFEAQKIADLINLPSRPELLASLMGTLKAPLANLVGVLNATLGNLVGTLNALNTKKNNK